MIGTRETAPTRGGQITPEFKSTNGIQLRARVAICGAGGAPSEGVIYSLKKTGRFEVLGFGADRSDLLGSIADDRYLIPYARDRDYKAKLLDLIDKTKPDLIHFQNDLEVLMASEFRQEIESLGTKVFMPRHEVIETCTNKYLSYLKFRNAGLVVPKNVLLKDDAELSEVFEDLMDAEGRIWIRDSRVGGGGKGSLSTTSLAHAREWINAADGWGHYLAAEHLTTSTVTWQSLWSHGNLIACQGRKRFGWVHGDRSASGVTGVTQVGETFSSKNLDELSRKAVFSVDSEPHGLYGVDFTVDKNRILNPTEINISRFFTTIRFFTEAGLNMPEIFVNLGLGQVVETSNGSINPLEDGLLWLRGMDRSPVLSNRAAFEKAFNE